jgi:hypothetical protein
VKHLQSKLSEGLKQLDTMNSRVKCEVKNTIARSKEELKNFKDYELRIESMLAQKQIALRDELNSKYMKEETEVNRLVDELNSQRDSLSECQRQLIYLQDLLSKGELMRG